MIEYICTPYGKNGSFRGAEIGAIELYNKLKKQQKNVQYSCLPDSSEPEVSIFEKICSVTSLAQKPIMLGGDHSVAIAHWSGIYKRLIQQKPQYRLGLLWIDAHLDAHTQESSDSGNRHGMSTASLLGYGEEAFSTLGCKQAKVKADNLVFWGTRSYEQSEYDFICEIGAHIITSEEILDDYQASIEKALFLVNQNTDGVAVSFDVDVLDPKIAPATGYRETDGISFAHLCDMFQAIEKSDMNVVGMELVEFFPELDPNKMTEQLIDTLLPQFEKILS